MIPTEQNFRDTYLPSKLPAGYNADNPRFPFCSQTNLHWRLDSCPKTPGINRTTASTKTIAARHPLVKYIVADANFFDLLHFQEPAHQFLHNGRKVRLGVHSAANSRHFAAVKIVPLRRKINQLGISVFSRFDGALHRFRHHHHSGTATIRDGHRLCDAYYRQNREYRSRLISNIPFFLACLMMLSSKGPRK